MPSRLLRIAMLLLMLVLAGCSSVPENAHNESHPNDPLEGLIARCGKLTTIT